ncbi:MAG: FKBP-type peptidyl-prolyl cis-trans isomerase [Bacteroidales bacterium]|nr:FKBP-type peptidyl-prolyl cis-trans isomerase [Bacteroidales bacterium]
MNNNRTIKKLLTLLVILSLFPGGGCQSDQDGFLTTPEGLSYKFHKQNKAGIGVLIGDKVTANVVFRTMDTVFFVSSRDLTVPYQFEILEPRFPGDIYDAFLLMAVEDSATFIIDGDSLFLLDFEIQEFPEFIGPTTKVYMDVKLLDVLPRKEFLQEKETYKDRVDQLLTELKEREEDDIRSYLEQNNIRINPTESGLYYIELERGNGPAVEPGKTVKVDYSAMFINGEIFETTKQDIAMKYDIFDSVMRYQPFQYLQGDTLMIVGWNEGLSYMKQGGRALLVVPSILAYGEEGVEGYIPPFAPLIYEVEVLEVK